MMQITEQMARRIRQVIPKLNEAHPFIEIPDMGGHFIALATTEIPEKAKRWVELGIEGKNYIVFTQINGGD